MIPLGPFELLSEWLKRNMKVQFTDTTKTYPCVVVVMLVSNILWCCNSVVVFLREKAYLINFPRP